MTTVGQELGEDLRGEQEPVDLVDVGVKALEDLVDVAPVQVRGGLDRGELIRHHDAAALVIARKRGGAVDEEAPLGDLVGEAPHLGVHRQDGARRLVVGRERLVLDVPGA